MTLTRPRPRPAAVLGVWVSVLAALAAWRPVRAGDAWFHLAAGRVIAEQGLPRYDTWSWTAAGTPLQLTGWGSDAVLYQLWRLGGLTLVSLLGPLVVLVVAVGVWWCATRLGARSGPAWAAAALSATVTVVGVDVRPQLVTYAVTAPYLYLALQAGGAARRRTRLWALAGVLAMGAVWVNLHTGGLSGPLLAGAAMVGLGLDRRLAREAIPWVAAGRVLAVATVATLCSPYGVEMWTHARLVRAQSEVISEWAHAWHSPTYAVLLIAPFLVLTGVVAGWAWRSRRGFTVALPALLWAVLSVDAIRHSFQLTILATVAAAVLVPAGITGQLRRRLPGRLVTRWRDPVVAGGVLFLVLVSWAAVASVWDIGARSRPAPGVMAGISALPARCRLLNDLVVGDAVVWARPEIPVSADGRNDMYGARRVVAQYRWLHDRDVQAGLAAVERLEISCVLVRRPPRNEGSWRSLVDALIARGWTPIGHGDQIGAVAPHQER